MAATTHTAVAQLRADAEAKAAEAAALFETLTPEQAATVTEIGWTIAATAAHLASGVGFFIAASLKQFKRGKATRVPNFLLNGVNWATARANKGKSLADSAAKIRADTATVLPLLDDWTDANLAVRFEKPYYGAQTHEESLRYLLVGHYDEHLGQIRRALKMG